MNLDFRRLPPRSWLIVLFSFAAIVVLLYFFLVRAPDAKGDTRPPNTFPQRTEVPTLLSERTTVKLTVLALPGTTIWEGYSRVDFYTRDGELVKISWTDLVSHKGTLSLTKPDHPSKIWDRWVDRFHDQLLYEIQEGSHH